MNYRNVFVAVVSLLMCGAQVFANPHEYDADDYDIGNDYGSSVGMGELWEEPSRLGPASSPGKAYYRGVMLRDLTLMKLEKRRLESTLTLQEKQLQKLRSVRKKSRNNLSEYYACNEEIRDLQRAIKKNRYALKLTNRRIAKKEKEVRLF